MALVCEQLSTENPQMCAVWVEFNPLSGLAITHDQMVQISIPLFIIAGLILAYAIIATVANKL